MKPFALSLTVALFAVAAAHGQPNQTDPIPALQQRCSTIQMIARTAGGNYQAANTLCAKLNAAAASADMVAEAQTVHDLYQLLARMNLTPATAADRLAALESTASEVSGEELFYSLTNLAKVAFDAGDMDKATAYSQQLLEMAKQFPDDWNYGNAIYYGHFVKGRVALEAGNADEAASQLLAAGATPGSPQLNSFGPNVTLARDLLAKGQSQPVLDYLAECKSFWKQSHGKLDEWMVAIRAGNTPDFRSNLNY